MSKLIFQGKTKDVYTTDDSKVVRLQFKDDLIGKDGKFEPGGDQVALTMDGIGALNCQVSQKFFKLLTQQGVPNHYISAENDSMLVKRVQQFGYGLEVIVRYKAVGSFYRRYARYIEEGEDLSGVVEFALKDNERGDPFANFDTLAELGLLIDWQCTKIMELANKVGRIIKSFLAEGGLDVYDMKLEFGIVDGAILLADEISATSMRVYQNGIWMDDPVELSKRMLAIKSDE